MSRSDFSPNKNIVRTHLDRHFAGDKTPTLVMGVSGGADSMCLLHILHTLGVDVHIVHVNYQKRGSEADEDAALVRETAEKLGFPCEGITVDPGEAEGKNFQQWARKVRYKAFEVKAEEINADGIVTAHHRNDQIETILQKIFRGSGLASWSAMQVWDGRLFRPLLAVSRDEIEQYCAAFSVPYRDDATNFESRYARNFLRNEWLDELERHFPGWQKNVLRVAEQADVFSLSLQYILQSISDEKDRLQRRAFLNLDEKLQKSVLLYYTNRVDKDAEISRQALAELQKLPDLQTGKSMQLTQNVELMRDRDFLKLVVNSDDTEAFLMLDKKELELTSVSFNGLVIALQCYENPDFGESLYLDADAFAWPLRIRRWRAGDRFQPLGMQGHQTVADHLANRKISASEKHNALVIESFEETICAVIFPPIEKRVPPGTISEKVKCGSSTQTCLIVK